MKLAATAARRGGWFDRRDALAAGYSDGDIQKRVAAGQWIRLCRGAYAEPGHEVRTAPSWEQRFWQHLHTAKAVYHRLGGRAVVSHQSALLLHGVAISELDLSRIHLTSRHGAGRSRGIVCEHAANPPVLDAVVLEGIQMTSGPRSVVETIRATSYPVAVCVVDQALRRQVASAEQLNDALGLFAGRPGISTAVRAVWFGDGRAESVGESRLRVLLSDLGLPTPSPQAEIRDATGRLIARVDFLLDCWRLVIEFDGAVKYGGGDSAALVAEKIREDKLRDLGYEVVRVTWADLARPAELITRIRRAIDRSQRAGVASFAANGRL